MTMGGMKIDEAITLLIEIRNDYFRQGTSRFDAMSAGIAALTEVATKKPVDGSDVRLINANTLKHRRGIAGDEILHEIIDTEPTIEAEPVRHGRWINDELHGKYNCTCCNKGTWRGFGVFDFCPKCGAKMNLRTPTEWQLDRADSAADVSGMDIEKYKESMPRCKDCTGFGWGECKTVAENEVACKDFERKPILATVYEEENENDD